MAVEAPSTPSLVIGKRPGPVVPVVGTDACFPVNRIFCVGRNYAEHAKEMGYTGREPPFFFMKYADAILPASEGRVETMAYPSLTADLQHEVELVAAIGTGGSDIAVNDALAHVFGYAVGLDMTRRDLQTDMKKQGRPWEIGKAFAQSAPIGAILPAAQAGDIASAEIVLTVNDAPRQSSTISNMIWSIAEIVANISTAWELQPGDLIYTGTPEGVGTVTRGDVMAARITGLPAITIRINP